MSDGYLSRDRAHLADLQPDPPAWFRSLAVE